MAGRVVQDEQDLFAGDPVAPQSRPVIDVWGKGGSVHAGGDQQAGEGVGGIAGGLGGGVALELQEDPAVGEAVGEVVGGVDAEGGLAHSGHAIHRVRRDCSPRPVSRVEQRAEFDVAADEVGDVTAHAEHRCRRGERRGFWWCDGERGRVRWVGMVGQGDPSNGRGFLFRHSCRKVAGSTVRLCRTTSSKNQPEVMSASATTEPGTKRQAIRLGRGR